MKKIQIVETEELLQYADFDRCEVWLRNRISREELDARVINVPELSESPLPSSMKLPQLLSLLWKHYPNRELTDEQGEIIESVMTFSYEVLTKDKENFAVKSYVCQEECITVLPAPRPRRPDRKLNSVM